MNKYLLNKSLLIIVSVFFMGNTYATNDSIPKVFQGDTPNSTVKISYKDIDKFLNISVIDMGRSSRKKAKRIQPNIGTRLTNQRRRSTTLEGNRFNFEAFSREDNGAVIGAIKASLINVPNEISLSELTINDQVAYWLNLYNITVLDELTNVYPKKNLKYISVGDESIFSKKLLTVANISLSLNDIQDILDAKWGNDPLVMYGLYQGIIGGPNIRKQAFTGANVQRLLKDNAVEFINSNRGTMRSRDNKFRVSSLYQRNSHYFPSYNNDLTAHLAKYLLRSFVESLESSDEIIANINDWKITDIYGTTYNYGGSVNDNSAALMPVMRDQQWVAGKVVIERSARFSKEQVGLLTELNNKRLENIGSVTVKDLDDK